MDNQNLYNQPPIETPVAGSQIPAAPNPSPKKKKWLAPVIIVSSIAVVALIGLVIFLILSNQGGSTGDNGSTDQEQETEISIDDVPELEIEIPEDDETGSEEETESRELALIRKYHSDLYTYIDDLDSNDYENKDSYTDATRFEVSSYIYNISGSLSAPDFSNRFLLATILRNFGDELEMDNKCDNNFIPESDILSYAKTLLSGDLGLRYYTVNTLEEDFRYEVGGYICMPGGTGDGGLGWVHEIIDFEEKETDGLKTLEISEKAVYSEGPFYYSDYCYDGVSTYWCDGDDVLVYTPDKKRLVARVSDPEAGLDMGLPYNADLKVILGEELLNKLDTYKYTFVDNGSSGWALSKIERIPAGQ
ncbi:MAG: hypothetical protein Q4B34_01895 [Candidatus Saccharibacteria bacterium]|nr:hypothetical protein [Candidatus Saccharibacteria bacterium]